MAYVDSLFLHTAGSYSVFLGHIFPDFCVITLASRFFSNPGSSAPHKHTSNSLATPSILALLPEFSESRRSKATPSADLEYQLKECDISRSQALVLLTSKA